MPSMARVIISQAAFMAKPPATEAMPANSIPTTRVYFAPIRSETTEAANPPNAPASWTTPTRAPAATKLIWRSSRINSSAEGNFHTCIATIMPVATTTVHARAPAPVVAITTKHTLGVVKSTRLRLSVSASYHARCDHTCSREIRFRAKTQQNDRSKAWTIHVDIRILIGLVSAQYRHGCNRGDPQLITHFRYGRRSNPSPSPSWAFRSGIRLTASPVDPLDTAVSAQPRGAYFGVCNHWHVLWSDRLDGRWRRSCAAIDSPGWFPGRHPDGIRSLGCKFICGRC